MRFLFIMSLVATLSAALVDLPCRAAEPAVSQNGIRGLGSKPLVRVLTPGAPSDKTWLYQVALPFQVSSTKAAIFCNIREALAQGVDFEAGNDVIVFGTLAEIESTTPVVANRNHSEPNPNTSPAGQPATMVKYPIRGGFIPLGAIRSDGTSHPHAGTGFGFSLAQGWKVLQAGPPPYLQNSFAGAEAYSYLEFQQFKFDGDRFSVTNTQRVSGNKLFEGWQITNGGMTNAVADGDDLLLTMVGKSKFNAEGHRHNGAVLLRMRRVEGAWKAVACEPIPQLTDTIEPSLVRDVDGRLIATARGSGEKRHDIHVVRSDDGGRTWSDLVEMKNLIGAGPITLNQAVDGTPYIAANLRAVTPGPRDPLTLAAIAKKVKVEPGTNSRNTLSLWPLSADRTSLLANMDVLDCRAEFGPPNGSNWTWRADHPSGMTVRLADGLWHHVLGFRVQDYREIKEAMPPTSRTGMYLQEVLSSGAPHPIWNF